MKVLFAAVLLILTAGAAMALDDAPRPGPKDGVSDTTTEKQPEAKITRSAGSGVQEEFTLPSGNIGCIYTPQGGTEVYQPEDGGPELACDRVEPQYVRVTLGASGAATINRDVGDPSCCSLGTVLDYGQVWKAGPFSCSSTRKGLACERRDGHSMFLSRARLSAD
ncbi:hypothetical protein [Pararhizobium sp.]|uniref:hypothetical protein n=1 Tax=Pararhizobium sp. TaxID=1977563 RepID=UPI002718B1DC|nr:hypothetical protein [Pararhizobium sp.]MDO9415129.1 hypothetical protein [Pararhizobium sp.]